MRSLARGFTMRKDGRVPRGDWFSFENKKSAKPKVYIYDEIGFWGTAASDFVKQLDEIDAGSFELHLNSPGGEIFDGLAIYNAIKNHDAKVSVYVDGLAASAASFIAQAGDEVIMARNAELMIHDGIAFCFGNEQAMLDTAEILSDLSNNIADIYAHRAGQRDYANATVEAFRGLMREETWYTGKEAVDGGLADTVLDHDDEEAEDAKNKWDLGFYNHAGREKAESPSRVLQRVLVTNQAKENRVTQPKNENEGVQPPETTPAPPPDDTPPSEGDPTPEPAPAEPAPAAPQTDPTPEPSNQQGVMIDGKLTTDWAAINRHIASMGNAQKEHEDSFRTSFVEGLASDNKIPATMVDNLTAHALSLNAEQFASFKASYESLPKMSLLDDHSQQQPGSPASNKGGQAPQTPGAKDIDDEISILEGTVAMHQRTMSKEQLEKTQSYMRLQELRQQQSNKS